MDQVLVRGKEDFDHDKRSQDVMFRRLNGRIVREGREGGEG